VIQELLFVFAMQLLCRWLCIKRPRNMTFANVWHRSEDTKVYVRGSSLVWIWPKNLESFKYHLGYEPISKLKSYKHNYLEL
jgi:hypothetical protein